MGKLAEGAGNDRFQNAMMNFYNTTVLLGSSLKIM
jgi:hypothetical protein